MAKKKNNDETREAKRRLTDIDVMEVSFVDTPANGQTFDIIKRLNRGGDDMNKIDATTEQKMDDGDKIDQINKLKEAVDANLKKQGIDPNNKEQLKEAEKKVKIDPNIAMEKRIKSLEKRLEDLSSAKSNPEPTSETEVAKTTEEPKPKVEVLQPQNNDLQELTGVVKVLTEEIVDMKKLLPMRKGLQENEEPRDKRDSIQKKLEILKSKEERDKLTDVHAENPIELAKRILKG